MGQEHAAGHAQVRDEAAENVETLNEKVPTLPLAATQLINGSVALLNEITNVKITGEEDRYSHTDLSDFQGKPARGAQGVPATFASRPKQTRGERPLDKNEGTKLPGRQDKPNAYRRDTPLGSGFSPERPAEPHGQDRPPAGGAEQLFAATPRPAPVRLGRAPDGPPPPPSSKLTKANAGRPTGPWSVVLSNISLPPIPPPCAGRRLLPPPPPDHEACRLFLLAGPANAGAAVTCPNANPIVNENNCMGEGTTAKPVGARKLQRRHRRLHDPDELQPRRKRAAEDRHRRGLRSPARTSTSASTGSATTAATARA